MAEDAVTVSKSSIKIAVVAVVFLVVGFALGSFVFPMTGKITAQAPIQQAPTGGEEQPPQPVTVSFDDDAVLGDANAPLTIVEFSDYECPFCGRHFQQSYPQLKSEYIDTGKVKLIFRDFPLSFHPSAQKAAEAAECAGDQNKYWEMHDKLFQNQQALGVDSLKQYAADLGLNTADFNSCLDSGKYTQEVQKDLTDGSAAGVGGTPSFFIGTPEKGYQLVVGAQPYAVFKQTIDAALA